MRITVLDQDTCSISGLETLRARDAVLPRQFPAQRRVARLLAVLQYHGRVVADRSIEALAELVGRESLQWRNAVGKDNVIGQGLYSFSFLRLLEKYHKLKQLWTSFRFYPRPVQMPDA